MDEDWEFVFSNFPCIPSLTLSTLSSTLILDNLSISSQSSTLKIFSWLLDITLTIFLGIGCDLLEFNLAGCPGEDTMLRFDGDNVTNCVIGLISLMHDNSSFVALGGPVIMGALESIYFRYFRYSIDGLGNSGVQGLWMVPDILGSLGDSRCVISCFDWARTNIGHRGIVMSCD